MLASSLPSATRFYRRPPECQPSGVAQRQNHVSNSTVLTALIAACLTPDLAGRGGIRRHGPGLREDG